MADLQAATNRANEVLAHPTSYGDEAVNLAAAFLAQQDALKVALAQSREDHNSMLAALGESIRLREELERERKRVKYLAAAFGGQCDKHANDEISTSCVFCALEQERTAREDAQQLIAAANAAYIDNGRFRLELLGRAEAAEQQTRMDTECIERLRRVGMEAEQRLAQAEESLRGIIAAEARGETAEYLAHIATRALQPAAAQGGKGE